MNGSTTPTSDPSLTETTPRATHLGALPEMTANHQRVGWNSQWARKHYKQMSACAPFSRPGSSSSPSSYVRRATGGDSSSFRS